MQSIENMDMEIVTADQNRNYGGSSTDPVAEVPVPIFQGGGQELAQRQPHEIAVGETPEKKVLKKQVSELVEALNFEEHIVHRKVHEAKVDAGTKVRQILKDQQDNFRRVATEYEQHARDILTKKLQKQGQMSMARPYQQ